MARLTKSTGFVASHFYWLEQWSDEQNRQRFRGCANQNGHGHNYRVDVTLEGPVNPDTGFILNFFDLEPILHRCIVEPLDHKNLNHDVPFFADHLPTLEYITHFVWARMAEALALFPQLTLIQVRVHEMPDLWVSHIKGDADLVHHLTRQYPFSAAHRLWNPAMDEETNHRAFGPCARVHGHNYTLQVTVKGTTDPLTGMLMDIGALDALMHEHIVRWVDHYFLDEDVPFLKGAVSSVENVAQVFYDRLADVLPSSLSLVRVRLFESQTNWVDVDARSQVVAWSV